MIVEHKFYIGFKDCRKDLKIKNSSLLTFCENVAGIHGNMVGDGIKETLTHTFATWVLVSWKLKVLKRPEHGEFVTVRTWVHDFKRVYSYREFEIVSEQGEILARCISKWVHINIQNTMPIRVTEELGLKYEPETTTGFEEGADVIIKEPENAIKEYAHTVREDWIDMNFHMNNTWYVTLTHLAFAENGMEFPEADTLEVLYKKEIKVGEKVKCFIYEGEEEYIVSIKSEDENVLHALLRFPK